MNARTSRERAAIAAVLSAMALVVLDAGIVNVALPTIGRTFAETPARSLLVVTVYQLALVIGLLPCAHAADRIGYRRLFLSGLIVFSSSSLLCALAPTLPLLVAARFFQGLGGAAIMALGIALLRFALGRDRLGFAIAWNALVVALCSALAPTIGALILSFASWRLLFVSTLPMAAIALAASPSLPVVKTDGAPVDLVGVSLYAGAASCAIMAAELARSTPLIAFGVAVAAIFCGCLLFRRDRTKLAPLVPLDLLAMRPFRNSVVASIFFFTGQSAGLLGLTFYLQLSLGRSATTAGLVIVAWPAGVAVTSRLAGWLADRFETRWICATGGLVFGSGIAGAALWPVGQTVAPLAACALICGIGFGLFQVPNNRTMFLAAPANRSAAAGGLQGTARLTGQTAGALLVTFVVSAAPLSIAPRVAMGLAGLSAVIAAWASWLRTAPPRSREGARRTDHCPALGQRRSVNDGTARRTHWCDSVSLLPCRSACSGQRPNRSLFDSVRVPHTGPLAMGRLEEESMKAFHAAASLACLVLPLSGTPAKAPAVSQAAPAFAVEQVAIGAPVHRTALVIWRPAGLVEANAAGANGKKFPLVVMSHGTGAGPTAHIDTAQALAAAGFIVAAPMHPGDNFQDDSNVGRPEWMANRSHDVSSTIDYMTGEWPSHAQVDGKKVGMFGLSAGATTALISLGGVPDLGRLAPHCAAHPEFVCKIIPPQADPAGAAAPRWTHDPRVAAAVIAAPGLGFLFEPAGLAKVQAPIQLWVGSEDDTVPYETNAAVVRRLLPHSPEFHQVDGAVHLSFLAPCTPESPPQICQDRKGFDRAAFHEEFNRSVVGFFRQHLTGKNVGR